MTTIVCVRRGNSVALGGDGQVSLGNTIIKGTARKVRRLYHNQVIAGFAGGTADAFTLFDHFESKLEKHGGQLIRAAVELAKDWRTDRTLAALPGPHPKVQTPPVRAARRELQSATRTRRSSRSAVIRSIA